RGQDHEIAAQGKNLRRLSAQFAGADLGRGLFHTRPRGCTSIGAGDVGGTGPHQGRQPIHAAQSGQAPRRPEAGPVEGYRAGEAEAPGFADVARSVRLRSPDSRSPSLRQRDELLVVTWHGVEAGELPVRFGLLDALLAR